MTTGPNERGRRARRSARASGRSPAAALLALAGILFHALVPFLHMPAAASSPFGPTFSICTATGPAFVSAADLGVDDGSDGTVPPARSVVFCPVCAAAHLMLFLPSAVPVRAPGVTVEAAWAAREPIAPIQRTGGFDSLPRAPPATA